MSISKAFLAFFAVVSAMGAYIKDISKAFNLPIAGFSQEYEFPHVIPRREMRELGNIFVEDIFDFVTTSDALKPSFEAFNGGTSKELGMVIGIALCRRIGQLWGKEDAKPSLRSNSAIGLHELREGDQPRSFVYSQMTDIPCVVDAERAIQFRIIPAFIVESDDQSGSIRYFFFLATFAIRPGQEPSRLLDLVGTTQDRQVVFFVKHVFNIWYEYWKKKVSRTLSKEHNSERQFVLLKAYGAHESLTHLNAWVLTSNDTATALHSLLNAYRSHSNPSSSNVQSGSRIPSIWNLTRALEGSANQGLDVIRSTSLSTHHSQSFSHSSSEHRYSSISRSLILQDRSIPSSSSQTESESIIPISQSTHRHNIFQISSEYHSPSISRRFSLQTIPTIPDILTSPRFDTTVLSSPSAYHRQISLHSSSEHHNPSISRSLSMQNISSIPAISASPRFEITVPSSPSAYRRQISLHSSSEHHNPSILRSLSMQNIPRIPAISASPRFETTVPSSPSAYHRQISLHSSSEHHHPSILRSLSMQNIPSIPAISASPRFETTVPSSPSAYHRQISLHSSSEHHHPSILRSLSMQNIPSIPAISASPRFETTVPSSPREHHRQITFHSLSEHHRPSISRSLSLHDRPSIPVSRAEKESESIVRSSTSDRHASILDDPSTDLRLAVAERESIARNSRNDPHPSTSDDPSTDLSLTICGSTPSLDLNLPPPGEWNIPHSASKKSRH